MNALTAALKEELNVEMISLGGLQVPESVVVSWGIMLFLVIVSILLTRNLKVDHISRRQAILELVVTMIDNFFTGLLGEQGRRYVPYLMTVALYIACANLIGVFGIKPPTKDLNVTAALALMSGNLFGNPSRRMTMIGVTGTKGKTTTTHMIKSVLEAAGRKVGMIGTNGIYFLGHHQETANTTPESYELQKTFREFLDAGCDTALMEVSSQGLMMDRVAGIHYDIGVFTNLSPDHIGPGEHKTFEEYRSWKGQLFKRCTTGVVNIDDENTEALLEGHTCKLVTYGCSEKADYRAGTYQLLRTHDFLGVQFHVSGKDDMDVKVNMPGEFSVYNALAALTQLPRLIVGRVHQGDRALVPLALLIHQREDPPRARKGHDDRVELLGDLADRHGEAAAQLQERGNCTQCQTAYAVERQCTAQHCQQHILDIAQIVHDRHKDIGEAVRPCGVLEQFVVVLVEVRLGLPLPFATPPGTCR